MATSTTVLEVEDALVALLGTALAPTPVTYAWPGKSTEPLCVFLGPHPGVADLLLDASGEDPVIKAGRRQMHEAYRLVVTIWAYRPDVSPDKARDAVVSAKSIFDVIDTTIRNNSKLGLDSIIGAEIVEYPRRLFPFQGGWACEWRVTIEVEARLT